MLNLFGSSIFPWQEPIFQTHFTFWNHLRTAVTYLHQLWNISDFLLYFLKFDFLKIVSNVGTKVLHYLIDFLRRNLCFVWVVCICKIQHILYLLQLTPLQYIVYLFESHNDWLFFIVSLLWPPLDAVWSNRYDFLNASNAIH